MRKIKTISMVCFFFLLFHVCDVKAAVEPKIIQVSDFTEEETFAYLKMPWNLSKEGTFWPETTAYEGEII